MEAVNLVQVHLARENISFPDKFVYQICEELIEYRLLNTSCSFDLERFAYEVFSELKRYRPPIRARRLLDWIIHPSRRNEIRGDLDEHYPIILKRDGKKTANRWFWWQVIRAAWPTWKQFTWGTALAWIWKRFIGS